MWPGLAGVSTHVPEAPGDVDLDLAGCRCTGKPATLRGEDGR